MKVAPGLFQFTAIDDCTRMRVLGLYPRRTAANAVNFLEERLLEEFPFPIQRVQADRGAEFFGEAFQEALHRDHIKFRPTPPRSPHLNGKVERSHLTDQVEFWATADVSDPQLDDRLGEWQFFYNMYRRHGALDGRTPHQQMCEVLSRTPWSWEGWDAYDEEKEYQLGGRDRNYELDQRLTKLKRSG